MMWTMPYWTAGLLQGAAGAGWPATMTAISVLVIAVSVFVIAVVVVTGALMLRGTIARTDQLLARISGEVAPLAHRLRSTAESADQMAASLRSDVQRISRTITAATDGVQDVLTRSERRLKEFDALLHVVQHEAEDAVVSAAATVRGVRAVATAFSEDAVDALGFGSDDDDLEDDVDCDEEEIDDGDDTGNVADRQEPQPRIRSRRGRRGRAGDV
jgi:uncharacterized protein YoxC